MLFTDLKLLLIPLAFVLWWRARHRPVGWLPWAGVQLGLALTAEGIAAALAFQGEHNVVVYNLYTPVEYAAFSLLLLAIPAPDPARRRLMVVFGTVVGAVFLWQAARIQWRLQAEFLGMVMVCGSFLLAVQGLFAALALANTGGEGPAYRATWFMLAGICLYFISSPPVFGLLKYFLDTEPALAMSLMHINDGLFAVRYTAVCIALWWLCRIPLRP